MNLELDNRRSGPMVAGLLVFVMSLAVWHNPGMAEEDSEVVVDPDVATCSAELTDTFVRELRLRTSAQVVSTVPDEEERFSPRLELDAVDEAACELRLVEADETRSLVVEEDARELEIASIASRLAWIIDGHEVPESNGLFDSPAEDEDHFEEASAVSQEAAGVTGRRVVDIASGMSTEGQQMSTASQQPTRLGISTRAIGGALLLPSLGDGVAMMRLDAGWKPWSKVRFGVSGRLPMGVLEAEEAGVESRYRPWSIDVTAGFVQGVGRNWTFSVDGGVRRTLLSLTATETDGTEPTTGEQPSRGEEEADRSGVVDETGQSVVEERPGRMTGTSDSAAEERLSSWSAVTNVTVSYSLTSMLVANLHSGVATSPVDRRIQDGDRVVMDLGHFEFELLLGLELKF